MSPPPPVIHNARLQIILNPCLHLCCEYSLFQVSPAKRWSIFLSSSWHGWVQRGTLSSKRPCFQTRGLRVTTLCFETFILFLLNFTKFPGRCTCRSTPVRYRCVTPLTVTPLCLSSSCLTEPETVKLCFIFTYFLCKKKMLKICLPTSQKDSSVSTWDIIYDLKKKKRCKGGIFINY